MVCCAAGSDHNFTDGFNIFRRPVQFIKMNSLAIFRNTAAHSVTNSLWLFENFFDHEVIEAAFFGCFGIPIHQEYFLRNGVAFKVSYPDIVFLYDCHFAVVHNIRLTRVA